MICQTKHTIATLFLLFQTEILRLCCQSYMTYILIFNLQIQYPKFGRSLSWAWSLSFNISQVNNVDLLFVEVFFLQSNKCWLNYKPRFQHNGGRGITVTLLTWKVGVAIACLVCHSNALLFWLLVVGVNKKQRLMIRKKLK